jgi:signal peptidase II
MQNAFRSPAALARFFGAAAIGIALDQWTKFAAFSNATLADEPCRFIPGWLEFEVVKNRGAVFGLGQGQRILFVTVSIAAVAFLIYLFSASDNRRIYQILLGMLLAGVMGNLYDRMALGYVRDMIHIFPAWPKLFPWIFNVADSLLCVGVTLMIFYNLLPQTPKKQE